MSDVGAFKIKEPRRTTVEHEEVEYTPDAIREIWSNDTADTSLVLALLERCESLAAALATATAELAARGEVERLRLAADMLREIPRAALSSDKVYREDWEELFTDEDGAALYLDTAVDRVLDRITRKESK